MDDKECSMSEQQKKFEAALLSLDRITAKELLSSECEKIGAMAAVEHIIVPALEKIGDGWEFGDLSLAQIYMSGKLCEELVSTLLPSGLSKKNNDLKMAIAVLEDHHTLGKNIIYSILRANGYQLIDYGNGKKVDELADNVIEDDIDILLISVLMLRSALRVTDLVKELHKRGAKTKVVVGGAPFRFDSKLSQEVGAFASGNNGKDAIKIVRQLTKDVQNEN